MRNKICFRQDKTNHPKRASSPSRTSHDGRLVTFLLLVIHYCAKDWGQQHLKRCIQNKDKQGVLHPDWSQNTKADLDDFFSFFFSQVFIVIWCLTLITCNSKDILSTLQTFISPVILKESYSDAYVTVGLGPSIWQFLFTFMFTLSSLIGKDCVDSVRFFISPVSLMELCSGVGQWPLG